LRPTIDEIVAAYQSIHGRGPPVDELSDEEDPEEPEQEAPGGSGAPGGERCGEADED
jgi:hypothetical protein